MRVLHLVKTSHGAHWAFRQMRELVRLGVEVHVALPPGGPMSAEYAMAGIVVHPLPLPSRAVGRWRSSFQQMRSLVARVRPDLLHSHFVGTTLTMRLALGKAHPVPRIFQVPGPLHLEHSFFRRAELATAGPADYWIGSCRWTCERYRSCGVPAARVFLSYYGIDIENMVPREPGRLRGELRLDPDARLVGMVAYMYAPKRYLGQHRGIKGHEDLIDAIALCARVDPKIQGVIIGGAWGSAHTYEARVREYGRRRCGDRVRILGTRHDIPELYADLDVVAHPSHSENLGGAAESLLLGVPTVATAVGGFPDLITNAESGWLVAPRQPAELARAILDALQEPDRAREMARQGQKTARELLDVRRTAREVLELYQGIVSGRSPARAAAASSMEKAA